VLHISENRAIGNRNIQDVGSAPVPTLKDVGAFALIGDESVDRPALQDMGAWPIPLLRFILLFYDKEGIVKSRTVTFL
jgi:hypothetical protein